MSSEEKFKDILKEKLDAKEFPFNTENWNRAQLMIDAERGRKKRIIPFILLCIGIFISGGLCFYFLSNTILAPTLDQAVKPNHEKPNPVEPMRTEMHDEKKISGINENFKNVPGKVAEQSGGEKYAGVNTQGDNQNQTIFEAGAKSGQNALAKPLPIAEENKLMHAAVTINKATTKTAVLLNTKQNPAVSTDGQQDAATGNTQPERGQIPAGNVGNEIVFATQKSNEEAKVPAKIPEMGTKIEEAKAKDPESVASVTVSPENPSLVNEPMATAMASTSAENAAADKPDTLLPKEKKEPKNIFSVEAGLYYHIGWKNTGKTDANGINPIAGFNYLRQLTDKTGLSIGLHYTTVGNLSSYSHESKDTYYSFGETSEMTVITPVKIHYLNVPVKVQYHLDGKNSIGLGYTFGYLLTVNNKVENYTQRLNSSSEKVVSKTKGYAQGFNSFDSQLALFYRRRLQSGLFANAELFYGISDIKDNSFFESHYFERNMGIKLTLIYNIFKR